MLAWWLAAALAAVVVALLLRLRALRRAMLTVQQDMQGRLQQAAVRAQRQAVAEERERIYADLHDDLGARLLQLVYAATDAAQADLARAALQDLRDVVTRSRSEVGSLEHVLDDIRCEAVQRLAAAGIELLWEAPAELPEVEIEASRALHLYRIVREAISNALRHARAQRLRVRVRVGAERLDLELTDDGDAGPPTAPSGRGMRNMQARAGQLQGAIHWLPGTLGGTKVLLSVPLAQERAASTAAQDCESGRAP
jgi:signal transduction histidine kinase